MASIKTIAIVEATERVGSSIARSLSKADGYQLLLASTDGAKLADLKSELERIQPCATMLTASCAKEAAWEADIIILVTPSATEKSVAERIREVATGKIVISVSNTDDSSANALTTANGTNARDELQKLLPHSKVVRVFNAAAAADSASAGAGSDAIEVLIAGEHDDAVQFVYTLAKHAGFNTVVRQ